MLSQTINGVRTENAGSHLYRVSSQSESADVTPAPQMSTLSDPQHLYIFPCNFTGSGCVMNAKNKDVVSFQSV